MFLVDDILLAPARSLFWIFKEIGHAVEEEQANEAEAITTKLSELYMMLETGQMTEAEFDAAEKALLDRLDAIKERTAGGKEEEDDEEAVIPEKASKRTGKTMKKTTGSLRLFYQMPASGFYCSAARAVWGKPRPRRQRRWSLPSAILRDPCFWFPPIPPIPFKTVSPERSLPPI